MKWTILMEKECNNAIYGYNFISLFPTAKYTHYNHELGNYEQSVVLSKKTLIKRLNEFGYCYKIENEKVYIRGY